MSDADENVGSVTEEAAKLLHALQDWAKESGSEYAGAAATAAGNSRSQALLVGVPASLPDHIIRTVCDRLCRASHFGPTSWAKKQALQP